MGGGGGKGGSAPAPSSGGSNYFMQGMQAKEGNARMDGMSQFDPSMPGYNEILNGYMFAHNLKVQKELGKIANERAQQDYANQQAAYYADQEARAEEMRRQGLIDTRDAYISNYFDSANAATSYVNDKMAAEKANAALMGVDYDVGEEAKQQRITDYFGTLWSEGDQQALEGSFNEVGAGDFVQDIFRTDGGATQVAGQVGNEQSGGGIKPKAKAVNPALINQEDQLDSGSTILGA